VPRSGDGPGASSSPDPNPKHPKQPFKGISRFGFTQNERPRRPGVRNEDQFSREQTPSEHEDAAERFLYPVAANGVPSGDEAAIAVAQVHATLAVAGRLAELCDAVGALDPGRRE
jgi:hypothetical protein